MMKYRSLQLCICFAIFALSGCSEPAEPIAEQPAPESVAADPIATVTNDVAIMGEHPYRVLVLRLDSDDLSARHGELFLAGGVHSYDEYRPHLSLKYNVTDDDLQLLRDNPVPVGKLILNGETFEPAN